MTQPFHEPHRQYLLQQCHYLKLEHARQYDQLLQGLDANDVELYLQACEAPFIACALCLAPTTNDASGRCSRCQESSEILQRLLGSFSKIWSTTVEGSRLLSNLSNLIPEQPHV